MFVPRSVKKTCSSSIVQETIEREGERDCNYDDDIVLLSKNQRWPVAGEPACVVCGRYGEYIIDDTNSDVCSIQCKKHHLKQLHAMTTDGLHTIATTTDTVHTITTTTEAIATTTDTSPEVGGASNITSEQALFLRKQFGIIVNSDDTPLPVMDFGQLSLTNQLLINLKEADYVVMTPIQMQVVPCVMSGRDMLVSSATGSGKSLSFLLPVIHLLTTQSGINKVLVICPTRELCMQLEEQSKQLMKGIPNMLTALLVGGVPLANQIHRLKSDIKMIIGTPGRLKDIISNHDVSLKASHVSVLVLDEVDSLLEMGFDDQINYILSKLPIKRQNLMFSATIPVKTERLAKKILANPLCVSVGKPGSPCSSIKHTILWAEEELKKKHLFAVVKDKDMFHPPAIVFVNSRKGSLLLAEALNKVDVAAVAIHGEMDQSKRSYIFTGVRDGKYEVIVSTGLLARGIHLESIRQVFIFDMPNTVEEFVHQVGRAGRLDSSGWAISFINNTNKGLFLDLIQLFEGNSDVSLPHQLLSSSHVTSHKQHKKRTRTACDNTRLVTTDSPLMELVCKKTK